ncbi:hypothetical protein [Marinicellulosiphila megalodicopiae]|uniref:hypothetical protein n=1 Tax=Marinicellulosiphila megalodicopiae TaxID=2724896 RepID=UPI003BAE21B0
MHFEADTPQKYNFLYSNLLSYFLHLEKSNQALDIIAPMISRIVAYREAYPETIDKFFYIKLSAPEVVVLIESFDFFTKQNKVDEETLDIISYYTELANEYQDDFAQLEFSEAVIHNFFDTYKQELQIYCQNTIDTHVEEGNEPVYVFCIQSFPGHHYKLATMNTVKSLHEMAGKDGLEEAATEGYNSELYNPACFEMESPSHDEYDKAENAIRELYEQLYDATSDFNENSFEEGTAEYEAIKKFEKLAYERFDTDSIDVLNNLNFEKLNKSDNFCAILYSHEDSEDDFYLNAQKTIPEDKFATIFPNAFKVPEDYIDFETATEAEIVTYLVTYIKDYYMKTVPDGRNYTPNKVYEYQKKLRTYKKLIDDEILDVVERIIDRAKPNPNDPEEIHYVNLFTKRGSVCSDLLSILLRVRVYKQTTQDRLISIYKKVIIGKKPSDDQSAFLHRDLAFLIYRTDTNKYPEVDFDFEKNYVNNMHDYIA